MSKEIVAVIYADNLETEKKCREYSFFTDIELKRGNTVLVPSRECMVVGCVTRVGIDKLTIRGFEDKMKTITDKIVLERPSDPV